MFSETTSNEISMFLSEFTKINLNEENNNAIDMASIFNTTLVREENSDYVLANFVGYTPTDNPEYLLALSIKYPIQSNTENILSIKGSDLYTLASSIFTINSR